MAQYLQPQTTVDHKLSVLETIEIYHQVSNKYDKSKYHPHRKYVVGPSMVSHWNRLLKDRYNQFVLNLGCGSGNDTWIFWKEFHEQVSLTVGVDISPDMIQIANQSKEEFESRLGLESGSMPVHFLVGDAFDLEGNEELKVLHNKQWDLVTACYLLHYSANVQELEMMCQSVSKMVQEGGTFLTMNSNPFINTTCVNDGQKRLGVYRSDFMTAKEEGRSELVDGDRFQISIDLNLNEEGQNENHQVNLVNHYFTPETYEKCLKKAGFTKIEFHPLETTCNYTGNDQDINQCSAIIIEATK